MRTAAELSVADVLLICVPGTSLEPLVDHNFILAVNWPGKSVLILEGLNPAPIAKALRDRGAAVGTLSTVPGLPDHFLVTGDRPAVRLAKTIVHSLKGKAIEIAQDRLLLFEAALTLTGSLFTPLVETAVESLRQTGLDQVLAAKTVDLLFLESLRSFRRSGRKSWSGPIARGDRPGMDAQQEALHLVKPAMGVFFRDAARFGFELYQTFPELTRYDKVRWKEFRKNYPS